MKSSKNGFTLLETLVAVAIFTIMMTAIMSMFPTVFKVNRQTRADQSTTIAAKSYMEQMRTHLSSTANFDSNSTLPAPAASSTDGYTCTPSMTQVQGGITTKGVAVPLIQRVTLSCARTGESTLIFTEDFGRPAFPILLPTVTGSS